MKIDKASTLVMIGDSITDAGRARPVGEGGGLGSGYVYLVDSLLGAVYPERHIRVLNTGISGNTVRDLKSRWTTDVLDLKPDWLSIMIGTNDVWRQFDSLKRPTAAVYHEEYESTLAELVSLTRPQLKGGIVLMTPFYVEPHKDEPMRARMDEYGQIVKRVAQKNGSLFVDTQAYFDNATKEVYPGNFAGDRVHPNMYGTAILARSFLKAVDFEF
jgi:lysophospholipase L1-like esterase